jgi:tRNA G10  N-methylase Trm11
MQYYFILGKNPILSRAEVQAVLDKAEVRSLKSDGSTKLTMTAAPDKSKFEIYGKILFVETESELDVEWLNSRLGGTVKIGKILASMEDLAEFEELFFELVKFGGARFFYGFSLYPLAPKTNIQAIQKRLKIIAMEIKSKLRDQFGLSSRYVVSKEPELSSVIVAKNKLLKNGAEICFFIKQGQVLMGQTLAVQEFEKFGARDYDRPGRDDVSGMLPPKLARMMINLAQVESDATILDPFCGSGTILQEALVLGYSNLTGTDNSDRAVSDSLKNLEWFEAKSEGRSMKSEVNGRKVEVFELDVKDLSSKFKANSIDAIITEPFLGPPVRGNESRQQIMTTIQALESLYLNAFVQYAKVLNKGGKVVMVFPVYNFKNTQFNLEILGQIEKLGFAKLNKEDLLYYREGQFVRRSIVIFQKVL